MGAGEIDRAAEAGARLLADHAFDDPFAAAIKSSRMAMVITDPHEADNPIIFCNAAFSELTGYAASETIGRNCRFLQGRDTDPEAVRVLGEAVSRERPARVDLLNYRRDGTTFWNALYMSPVKGRDGTTRYFFASQLDVTAVKDRERELRDMRAESQREVNRATAELEAALEAKTVLLHEVDHRVKNNLLMIASIVRLQAKRTADPSAKSALLAVLRRVEAVSTVQRKLFNERDLSQFDVAAFTHELAVDLIGPTGTVAEFDLSPVLVPATKASPLALVVNELVTDAIEAASGNPGATISVAVRRSEGAATIRVGCRGTEAVARTVDPFAEMLVGACASQAGAVVTWNPDGLGGAEVRLPLGNEARP